MTPALIAARAFNVALIVWSAWLGSRHRAMSLAWPAAAALAAAAAQALLARSPRWSASRRLAAACALDILLVLWLARWTHQGEIVLGVLAPAIVLALEFGPAVGGLAVLVALATAGLGLASLPAMLLLALGPIAAGLAFAPARAGAAAAARATLARLRAAQIGEYLSFALFQLRDYAITISSLSEAIVQSAPKEDAKLLERADRLKSAAGELAVKLGRVLGDQSALTTGR
ncbi:MAG: hypothetical protein HYZ74_06830, partial [Elusimicrobia bacterium]|nr:hypothetical protein [Elusimicrobiota bacterium]